jgi:hypothetical protein
MCRLYSRDRAILLNASRLYRARATQTDGIVFWHRWKGTREGARDERDPEIGSTFKLGGAAVKGLGKSRDPRAIEPLTAALNDESYLVRKTAARALGDIGDARVVRPLITLIGESFHYSIARTALGAMEQVLDRAAAGAISKDVQAAAMLSDIGSIDHELRESLAWCSKESSARDWTMDCSQVRRLARKELIRRGLAA